MEIRGAALLGAACLCMNLWRATFLHHPYISFMAMKNRNVIRATAVYFIFFTLMATEHVFEHGYAADILGFDETNLIDLNWYVFAGIIAGCAFTYFTFALHKWKYKTMTAIAFTLAIGYLAWFYFSIDYGIEKEMLFVPLFFRGMASVIISIVFLTSIVQSGLSFKVFPQALTINGFTGAVMSATLGPAIIGEWLKHTIACNKGTPQFKHCGFQSTYNVYRYRGIWKYSANAGHDYINERNLWLVTDCCANFTTDNTSQLWKCPSVCHIPQMAHNTKRSKTHCFV